MPNTAPPNTRPNTIAPTNMSLIPLSVARLPQHVPAKCTHFADKNMLQHIDPGALAYRRNGSISTESAPTKRRPPGAKGGRLLRCVGPHLAGQRGMAGTV